MMGDGCALPFQVTEEITSLAIEIGQYAGSATTFEALHPNPALRRTDREGLSRNSGHYTEEAGAHDRKAEA